MTVGLRLTQEADVAAIIEKVGRIALGIANSAYQKGEARFLNFNCIILDVVEVTIGDGTQIGPAVQIYAADHPRDPERRRSGLELGRPVRIGRNVWIGGGAIILPGAVKGDDAVIGAGSVVTKDVGQCNGKFKLVG